MSASHPGTDPAGLRRTYAAGELSEHAVDVDAVAQFGRWLEDAVAYGIDEPNAMVLATASGDGVPAARTVLLKGVDERGLTFYTNYTSNKARDLDANPRAEVVFPWHAMQRQVRVAGTIERVSREETAAYFASRPRESQLGARASAQSRVVPDRATLDAAYAELEQRWPAGEAIPVPDFWGGYRLTPATIEFWQGRIGRLHDRLRYRKDGDRWRIERLAP